MNINVCEPSGERDKRHIDDEFFVVKSACKYFWVSSAATHNNEKSGWPLLLRMLEARIVRPTFIEMRYILYEFIFSSFIKGLYMDESAIVECLAGSCQKMGPNFDA